MKIVRVLNNNTLVVLDGEQQECIVAGKGIGFQRKQGQDLDPATVERTYYPDEVRSAGVLGALVSTIPDAHLRAAETALEAVKGVLPHFSYTSSAVVGLADHIGFAMFRQHRGVRTVFPLAGEITYLYPDELAAASEALRVVNAELGATLPPDEITPIALHLVSVGLATGGLPSAVRIGALIDQLFDVLEVAFPNTVDRRGASAARFVAHVRYLLIRTRLEQQLDGGGASALVAPLQAQHARAFSVAGKLQAIIELRLGSSLTNDEGAYLAMHVARIAQYSGV